MTTDTLEALREAREVMLIADARSRDEMHLSYEAFRPLWDRALSRINAALAEAERDITEQQPVAWKWEQYLFSGWQRRTTEEHPGESDLIRRVQPLYASPAPALGVEGVLNATMDLLALIEGDISGPAQRAGIIAEARAIIAVDLEKKHIVNNAKTIEALQKDNDRLQAEITRLLTAFDGLDLADKKYLPDRKIRHFF
jgi:hypothetical protein